MSFNPKIPEIYQIEVTNACNFFCDFCPRTVVDRPNSFIDIDLVKTISERDIGGSYFIEFQLSGEPLLHPKLSNIIDMFKGKVLTGLSTNGHLIDRQLDALFKLDYMTVSIDSMDKTIYEKLRKGGKFEHLWFNLGLLMANRPSSLTIDLQIIELDKFNRSWKQDFEQLQEFVTKEKWDVNIRTVPDCSLGIRDGEHVECTDLCLNPWGSVTIHSDGDVVPCCFAFDKHIVYGNLKDQGLEDIWNKSPVLESLRTQHITKKYNENLCSKCYMRSPMFLHLDIFKNSIARKILNEKKI